MELKFSAAAATRLQSDIQGTVVLTGADTYHVARQGFVVNYQAFPQIIVYCEVFSDVAAALAFARQCGLAPVCRAGGHNTAGYSVNDEMVVDVSRISYVVVDRSAKRAVVGAGTTFGRLNAVLDSYRLHVPGGGCDDVAVAGFMQGGGYGYTSMIYGMNCDSVVEAVVMLADTSTVVASKDSHADLFWALRGGTGNNFGVLLQVTYRLQELDDLWGFGIRWPLGNDLRGAKRVSAALQLLQSKYTGAAVPAHVGHQSTLNFIDKKPYLLLRGMYAGDSTEGQKLIAPLLDTEGAECDIPGRRGRYTDLNTFLNSHPDVPTVAPNTRTQADSLYIERQLHSDEWCTLARYFQTSSNFGNFIGLEGYGGAIAGLAPSDTAFLHRRVTFDVYIWVFWLNDAQEIESLSFLEGFRQVVLPLSNGHAYQNYQNRHNDNYRAMYWGDNFHRLLEIKHRYDPGGVFSYGHTIAAEPARYDEQ
jgi:FAD/FMN-containing dehydrogenase